MNDRQKVTAIACTVFVLGYCVVFTLYLFGIAPGLVKQPAAFGGFVLAGFIPLVMNDAHWLWRAGLMLVTLTGAGLVQVTDAAMAQKAANQAALAALHEQIRACEERASDPDLALNVYDAINAHRDADEGLRLQAERWALRAALLRAQASAPLLAADQRDAVRAAADGALAQEAAYRAAAADFAAHVKPVYADLLAKTDAPYEVYAAALDKVDAHLGAAAVTAGVLSQLGVIAMDRSVRERSQGNRAMAYFYSALTREPKNLHALESIGYAAWAIVGDRTSRLRYAAEGLQAAEDERQAVPREFAEAKAYLDPPAARELAERFKAFLPAWDKFAADKIERLRIQHSYYAALEASPRDADAALREAKAVYDNHQSDPEYADSYGFVLMRFARTEADLEAAQKLFHTAQSAPRRESTTPALAAKHLLEADALLRQIRGQDAKVDLRKTCA